MYKFREDNTYDEIREKSLMSWLAEVQVRGSYVDVCGAKLAVEYIQSLQDKIRLLEEKNQMKDRFLRQMKEKSNKSH